MTTLTVVPPAPVDLDFETRMSAVWQQVWAAEWTKLRDIGDHPMEAAQAAQREADLAVSTARVVRLTDPTRPTDAELEAGHARLLAADGTMTLGVEPPGADDSFLRKRCDAEQRERVFGGYPEVNVYYEHLLEFARANPRVVVWTAVQKPSAAGRIGMEPMPTKDETTKVTVRPFNLPVTVTHAELEEARTRGVESDTIFKAYYDRMRAAYDRPHGALEDYFKQAAEQTEDDKETP